MKEKIKINMGPGLVYAPWTTIDIPVSPVEFPVATMPEAPDHWETLEKYTNEWKRQVDGSQYATFNGHRIKVTLEAMFGYDNKNENI